MNFTDIPKPPALIELKTSAIIDKLIKSFLEQNPQLEDAFKAGGDPLKSLIEQCGYQFALLTNQINFAIKDNFIATATGDGLDNLVELVGLTRNQDEGDEQLRQRYVDSWHHLNTTGSRTSYLYHAKLAHPIIKDVNAWSGKPGYVNIAILTHLHNDKLQLVDADAQDEQTISDGRATTELIQLVNINLHNDSIKPLGDKIIIKSAEIINYTIVANIILAKDVQVEEKIIQDRLNAQLHALVSANHKFCQNILVSQILAALYNKTVKEVKLIEPQTDLIMTEAQVGFCTDITLNITLEKVISNNIIDDIECSINLSSNIEDGDIT